MDKVAAVQIGRNHHKATIEVNITGNNFEGEDNALHLTENVVKGFVSGNICERGIRIDGKRIICVNNVVTDVINNGSNNIIEPNYNPIH